jgi:protein SMG7
MGSRTAAEVFGAVASTSPTPGSASSKTFPTLPWGYFYTSASTDPALRNPATIRSTGSGWGSRPTSSGSPRAAQGVDNTTDPSRSLSGDQKKQNRLSGGPSTTSPLAYQGPQDWAMQTSLASMSRDNHIPQARDARQGWPGVSGDAASHSKRPSNMSLPSPSAPWQQIPPQISPVGMYHSANSPYPSALEFSAEDSSLPPVNSPWGVPMAQAQGYMYQGVTPPVGPLRQPAPAFPSYQQPSAPSLARSPGFPPGFAGSREFMNGSGVASYNHMPRRSQAAVATEGHSDQSLIDAWANDFGPRSAGSVPGAGFDGAPSQAPALRTDSRVVPVQLPGTEGSIWARGAKPNWNVKSQPK